MFKNGQKCIDVQCSNIFKIYLHIFLNLLQQKISLKNLIIALFPKCNMFKKKNLNKVIKIKLKVALPEDKRQSEEVQMCCGSGALGDRWSSLFHYKQRSIKWISACDETPAALL